MGRDSLQNRGTILILTLWVLGFLSILAVQLTFHIRQKISLLERLESRSQLSHSAHAGVKQALALLKIGKEERKTVELTPRQKELYLNNPQMFAHIILDQTQAEVTYQTSLGINVPLTKMFGFADENSKLNINKANVEEIKILLTHALDMEEETAFDLASAIVDWREAGKSELVGFYSDEYYETLEYPYEPKNAEFEIIDELLLVKGMTPSLYVRLLNFVTIYTDGSVNINTASIPVLMALGLDANLANQIVTVRRGEDGEEATGDDIILAPSNGVISQLMNFFELAESEIQQLNDLINAGRLLTHSEQYFIKSMASSQIRNEKRVISCVFNIQNGKIQYWREE